MNWWRHFFLARRLFTSHIYSANTLTVAVDLTCQSFVNTRKETSVYTFFQGFVKHVVIHCLPSKNSMIENILV